MANETKVEADKVDALIRASILSGGHELYDSVYGNADQEERRQIEEDIEWMTPDNIEEIQDILSSINSD